ncbi:hypothetical protein [Dyadobacter sediminis]|uniref:Uncharacterized protein n=1 Tax=Dyadobacter sediminis TaxID=1493691 RepID=A0A5R9KKR3_9BACT|nr:hypothetical protein [Dyadobacter sediminis]TLU96811.1 hypothetical protein FEM55_06710 [Dyadobacter sediminis]GGB85332.1 hypothetical protein GCM10011325_11170 [Dyadobacter sediminis]
MSPLDDDNDLYDDDLPGNYPPEEDVFRQGLIVDDIDPEDVTRLKREVEMDADDWNEKTFADDLTGDDLDVPGSEDDDYDEMIGKEDEENNYYSLGGDNHENLEENQGD